MIATPDASSREPSFPDNESIWASRAASANSVWVWIATAYLFYWVCFAAGSILKHKELNSVGGVIVLGVLTLMSVERLWVRMDAVAIAALGSMAGIPVVQLLIGDPVSPEYLFKHVSFFLVIVLSRILRLPPASRSRVRGILAAQVMAILLLSLTVYQGTSWDGGTRHSGLFLNPNNLALIPFLLLLLIDRKRDGFWLQLSAHAMVVIIMGFTATSGAVIGYAVGLWVYFSAGIPKSMRSLAYCAIGLTAVLGIGFLSLDGEKLLPQTRFTNQIAVMKSGFSDVTEGKEIAYYEREKLLGSGAGSGVWRLMHWRKTLVTFWEADSLEQVFGIGIGSSPQRLGVLPHNDYLRILFEQGYVGLALFVFACFRLIRGASPDIRYVAIATAIYCFSENNLDNFPFMSLLTLCLSANRVTTAGLNRVSSPIASRAELTGALAS